MLLLPPLDSLRFFEAAARHQGFARAAEELGVTPAAVAIEIETNHRGVDPDSCRSAAPPCWRRAAGRASQPTSAAGHCSTIWDGTPTGRTGSPARASPPRTCRAPRASASTACWSRPRCTGSAPPSGGPC